MDPALQHLLFETAQGTLKSLAGEGSAGLVGENGDQASARLESVLEQDGKWILRVRSDGLTLDHKIFVERCLLSALTPLVGPRTAPSIYFFRRAAAFNPHMGQPPVATEGPAPFGLKIRKKAIPGVRRIILVASGKGGVGKSTVSANLAMGLARAGERVGLLDADVYGPSAPLMFGVQGTMGVSDTGKLEPIVAQNVKLVSFGFLSDAQHPVIWRGPLVGKAIEQLCFSVAWGDLDFLIVDMPPGTGDVQLTVAERLPVTAAIIVSTPQDVALIDAHKAVSMFERLHIPLLGIVENMAYHRCSACDHEDLIFGHESFVTFARDRNLKVLARLPLERQIREDGDSGVPLVSRTGTPQAQAMLALTEQVRRY